MTYRLRWFTFPPLALLSLGCAKEVKDTEGSTYSFECNGGSCALTKLKGLKEENGGTKSADEKPTHRTENEGRVLLACPTDRAGFDCRPITCDQATPCARLGGADFTCEKGLCQAPARPLLSTDKLALCLAKTGAWRRTPEQLERITLARACTDDCQLPANCLVP